MDKLWTDRRDTLPAEGARSVAEFVTVWLIARDQVSPALPGFAEFETPGRAGSWPRWHREPSTINPFVDLLTNGMQGFDIETIAAVA